MNNRILEILTDKILLSTSRIKQNLKQKRQSERRQTFSKRIVGQDADNENQLLWPSLTNQL